MKSLTQNKPFRKRYRIVYSENEETFRKYTVQSRHWFSPFWFFESYHRTGHQAKEWIDNTKSPSCVVIHEE